MKENTKTGFLVFKTLVAVIAVAIGIATLDTPSALADAASVWATDASQPVPTPTAVLASPTPYPSSAPTTMVSSRTMDIPLSGPMTLLSAVKIALDHNPAVRTAREKINEGFANESYAFAKIFPTVQGVGTAAVQKDSALSGGGPFQGDVYNNYNVQLQLNQPLYDGGALFAAVRYADKDEKIRSLSVEMSERDTALLIIGDFYDVLLAQRKLAALNRTLKVLTETLQVTQSRYKIGRAQLLDVLSIKTQIALLVPQISQQENQIQISAAQLAHDMGDPDARQIQVNGTLEPMTNQQMESYSPESLRRLKSRILEFEQEALTIDQFEDTRAVTLAPNYPQASLIASIGRAAYAQSDLLTDYSTAWSVGLSLTIPIFSGLSSVAQKRQLASQGEQLLLAATTLQDQISLNQVQTRRNLEIARSTIASSKDAFVLAEQSLAEARRQYKLATIDYLQYLTAQSSLLTAESNFDQAKHDYLTSLAKYYVAAGYPLNQLILGLNEK